MASDGDATAAPPTSGGDDPLQKTSPRNSAHLANMAIPEARQQSFEELYGPPENLLEIEVRTAPMPPIYSLIFAGRVPLSRGRGPGDRGDCEQMESPID
jgi:hypothetical protein